MVDDVVVVDVVMVHMVVVDLIDNMSFSVRTIG